MRARTTMRCLTLLFAAVALAACGGSPVVGSTPVATTPGSALPVAAGAAAASDPTPPATPTSAPAAIEHDATHAAADDYAWDAAEATELALDGDSISVEGAGVDVDGSTATITAAGTYILRGTLADGQIRVDTQDAEVVRLVLDGVDLRSSVNAPIYVVDAEKTVIVLADGSDNSVADAATYVQADPAVDEPNAAIYASSDMTIAGAGSLTVTGSYNDAIASQDGLIIDGATISVSAADDGIRGKDYLVVNGGTLAVEAQGDGLKADNEEDEGQGYIAVAAGVFDITAGGDAIQAAGDVQISSGEFTLSSGAGSSGATLDASTSAKGIKAVTLLAIDGGSFTIDSADDAIHSNATITINGGTFALATGDDGVHADASLTINGGDLTISESYEGIESAVITLNGGNISLVSSDDALNVAGGNDGGGPGGGWGRDSFNADNGQLLTINGATVLIDSGGDGVDVNGSIEMYDGTVIVNGPTANMNAALDYDGTFAISGGLLVAAGSAGMAQTADASSSQSALLVNMDTTISAGTLFHIQSADGDSILSFAPTKSYQSVAFSSSQLQSGTSYRILLGGSATGTALNGLYQDGSYTPGDDYAGFTVQDTVTTLGETRRRFR